MQTLTFMMGNYPAELPTDYFYCRNHMWCQSRPDGQWRFGFSKYAIRLMQDVYFLEWSVNEGDAIALKQLIGNIETSKAVSDLFSPLAGTMTAINQEVLKDPSLINVGNYDVGWLFDMAGDASATMDVAAYMAYLEAGWENTQRILKGQMGD